MLDLDASVGDPRLFDDLERYMAARDLTAVDAGLSKKYISNPGAGEEVRGHLVVIAELGLAPYHGRAVRDPATFTGPWSRERRGDHIVARLAFVSTMFALAGHTSVDLYRGMAFEHSIGGRGACSYRRRSGAWSPRLKQSSAHTARWRCSPVGGSALTGC